MVRYIPIVVTINGAVDLLVLIAAGHFTGWRTNWKRLLGAAVLDCAYVGLCMSTGNVFLSKTLTRICVLTAMGGIAYGISRSAGKRTAMFVLLSMSMGGLASGLERGDFFYLLLSAGVLALICLLGFGGGQGRELVEVFIPDGAQPICVTALIDTGNTLRDPVTGEGVMVVGADVAARLLGLTDEELHNPLDTMLHRRGLRLVPYTAVGQPGGMLLGKTIDGVCIGNQKRKCLVAFAPNRIAGSGFNALLGGAV